MNRPEIAHCVASAPLYDSGYIILPNFNVILQYAFRGSPGALEAHKTADHTMTLRLTAFLMLLVAFCLHARKEAT